MTTATLQWSTGSLAGDKTGIDWQAGANLDHVDPYLVWFDITAFAGTAVAGHERLRVLLQRPDAGDKSPQQAFESSELSWTELAELPRQVRDGEVLRFELSVPLRTGDLNTVATPPLRAPADGEPARGRKVAQEAGRIVGFIDFGCAFAHPQFRVWRDGQATLETRVVALWDQNGREAGQGLVWSVPADFGYGAQTLRDYKSSAELDGSASYLRLGDYVRSFVYGGVVDERACYAGAGHGALARSVTHGTHIMDIATGHPSPLAQVPSLKRDDAQPHNLPVVFVSLPSQVSGHGVGGLLRAQVLDGLRYILSCAEPSSEVIVNLSYGAYGGPHDGTSMIEQAIDAEIEARRGKLQVVVAAGNARDKQLHARADLAAGLTASFLWNNRPDDATDSFAEFWWRDPEADLRFRVRPPGVELADGEGWLASGQAGVWRSGDGAVGALVFAHRVCQSTDARMALLAVAPTRQGLGRAAAPYGQWQIEVHNRGGKAVVIDGWTERDEPAFGSEAPPRQAYFSPGTSSEVLAEDTLSSLAQGTRTIVVGAYRPGGGVAANSSLGETHPLRVRSGPSFLAPSAEDEVHDGLPAAAVRSGTTVRLNGTSVAAAYVTRLLIQNEIESGPVAGRNPKPPTGGTASGAASSGTAVRVVI